MFACVGCCYCNFCSARFLHVEYLNMFCYAISLAVFVLQLKELEKLGPKKGVISQSVKDVVQSLVDDDLVLKDKIGTSVSLSACWLF